MDVRKVDTAASVAAGAAGATAGRQWLVVTGSIYRRRAQVLAWLASALSNFSDVVRIVGALQQQSNSVRPPAFVLETAAECRPPGGIVLCVRTTFQESVLLWGSQCCWMQHSLVAYPASRAFREDGKGLLFVEQTKYWVEPNPDERERTLGYKTGTTWVGAVTEPQRRAIAGRAMDRYALVSLFNIYMGLAGEAWETSQCSLLSAQAPGEQQFFSNVAARIMMRQGWRQGRPLGAPSAVNPIVEPIALPVHNGTTGLGYTSDLGGGRGSANFVAARSATGLHCCCSC